MDPLTQGALGAIAAQAAFGRRLPRSAWLIGAAAGMAADLDTFIEPLSDPLNGLTYHRHFTHALAFIPLGGLLAALPFLAWPASRGRRLTVLAASTIAYATHGLLDATTAYGTMLLWPFSDRRIAWDNMPIVDPLFTGLLIIGVLASVIARRVRLAQVTLSLAVLYMAVGAVQHARASTAQRQIAEARGHRIERSRVMLAPGGLVQWRAIYQCDGRLYGDAIRTPWLGPTTARLGTSTPHLTRAWFAESELRSPQVLAAFDRFAWFTDGYTAWDANYSNVIGDMRYCDSEAAFSSFWGLRIPRPDSRVPARMVGLPSPNGDRISRLWAGLLRAPDDYQPVPAIIAAMQSN